MGLIAKETHFKASNYHPQTKLWKGNVFRSICQEFYPQGGGVHPWADPPAVADLRGVRGARPPSKFFQFHAVCGKIWQNRMLAPPGGLAPSDRGILDLLLFFIQ